MDALNRVLLFDLFIKKDFYMLANKRSISDPLVYVDQSKNFLQLAMAIIAGLFFLLMAHNTNAQSIETPWVKYETSHFVLYTDIAEHEALEMIGQLEVFKASLQHLLKLDSRVPLPKLTAYRFNSKSLYAQFVRNQRVGGFYTNTLNGPIIVIGDSQNTLGNDLNIVFHEYVHFFQRAVAGPSHPTWYSEGIAEFFSSIKIEDEVVKIGQPPGARLMQLQRINMLELDSLFSLQGYDDSDILNNRMYPSAWLVTHFMMLSSRNGFDDYTSNLANMLALQANGVNGVDAFNQSFDISLGEFKALIRKYGRIRSLNGAQFPRPKVEAKVAIIPLSIGQSYAVIAPLGFGKSQNKAFEDMLTKGAALNEPLSQATLAAHLFFEGNNSEAQALLDKVLLSLPELSVTGEIATHIVPEVARATISGSKEIKAQTMHFVGESYYHLSRQIKNEKKKSISALEKKTYDGHIDQALRYFEASYAAKPQPYTIQRLMQVHDIKEDITQAKKFANELYQAIPLSLQINYEVGFFMADHDNKSFAKYLLSNVVKWSPESQVGIAAALRLASLDLE
jgi:hypothetical protein